MFEEKTYLLGCDIGGTFTDFALIDAAGGALIIEKCLTTPSDPALGVMQGLDLLAQQVPDLLQKVDTFIHGTTLVINAILERKGAKTALITTQGFRDILAMRREERYDRDDLFQVFPEPLVPRSRRVGIPERVAANGAVLIPLDEDALREAVSELVDSGVESIAVSLLHSYANSAHERRVASILNEQAPNIPVSLSVDVLPEAKEFERTSTTVTNAYCMPLISRYVDDLRSALAEKGFTGKFFLMNSNGGLTPGSTAKSLPVRMVESGPAGGAMATSHFSKLLREPSLVSFDMGGTTAKTCLIEDGKFRTTSEYEVDRTARFIKGSGIPLRVPVVDMIEIGAGGGSIASINEFGLMHVGPESAGASPGPACYGMGGMQPTVSDADLTLGYLDPEYFLGGRMHLHKGAADRSIGEMVAQPLGLSTIDAAWGIHDIVNENMAASVKAYLLERAHDPTGATLVAYGGAGPLHAYGIAKKLGIARILIPPGAGVMSALGFLSAPPAIELAKTHRVRLSQVDLDELHEVIEELRHRADELLSVSSLELPHVVSSADMRYVGQGYDVRVPIPVGGLGEEARRQIQEAFEDVYKRHYGRVYDDVDVEIVTVSVRVAAGSDSTNEPLLQKSAGAEGRAQDRERVVYLGPVRGYESVPVYRREALPSGFKETGPMIIEEKESTIVVGGDSEVTVDSYGIVAICV